MKLLVSFAFFLSLVSATSAQLLVKPQIPSPMPVCREAFMPKGEVLLSYPMEKLHDGKTIWLWRYHKRKLVDLLITNALGEKLTEKEILKALKKPTMVLVSSDGKPVHPYYLSVVKPGTLVIIDKTLQPKKDE